jgi:hypothetical protein
VVTARRPGEIIVRPALLASLTTSALSARSTDIRLPRRAGLPIAMCSGGTICRLEITMTIKILPNEKGNPAGKLADAELHFKDGPLEGLKLIGFGIWERKSGNGRNVTFPARQYSVNGERRSFALLRPIEDATAQDRIRELVLQAYAEFEAPTAVGV